MFSGVVGKGKAAAVATFGTETQRVVGSYLYDDSIRIMSSFEMNRFASLTYGDQVCDEMFELLESTLASPDEYSILTLQKALSLIKHLVIHGHERSVSMAWNIGRHVEMLRSYNTAVQSQRNNILVQIKGGEVDRAFVVRELAGELHDLLQSPEGIQILRMQNEDPNSLVPVGKTDEIGFAPTPNTAEEWIREQKARQPQIRSNLAKSESGFGGGYTAAAGGAEKAVVGAAHSIEEMLETARRNEERRANRYFDDRGEEERWREKVGESTVRHLTVSDLLCGVGGTADSSAAAAADAQPTQGETPDLLDLSGFGEGSGGGGGTDGTGGADDLLGLGSVPTSSTAGGMDLLSAGPVGDPSPAAAAPGAPGDLLGGANAAVDAAPAADGRQAQLEAQLEMQRRQIEMLQRQMKHPGFLHPEEEEGPGGDGGRILANGNIGEVVAGPKDDAAAPPSKRGVMNGSSSSAAASAISALEKLDINATSGYGPKSTASTTTPEGDGDDEGGEGHPHPPPPNAPPPPPPPASDDWEATATVGGDSSSLGAKSVLSHDAAPPNGTPGEMPPAPLGAPPPPPPVSDEVDDRPSASVGGVGISNPAAAGDMMGMVLQQQQQMMMQLQQQQQRMMMSGGGFDMGMGGPGAGGNPQELMMNLQRQQQELMMNMMMMQQQMAASGGGGNGASLPTPPIPGAQQTPYSNGSTNGFGRTTKDPMVAANPMMTMMMNHQGATATPAVVDHPQNPMGGMAAPQHQMRSIGGGGPGSSASNGTNK